MMTLGNAPGGPEFVNTLIEAIKVLSLLYSNTPDSRAEPHLESFLTRIEPYLVEAVGAGNAAVILDGLRRAVMTRKHEMEAGGASRA